MSEKNIFIQLLKNIGYGIVVSPLILLFIACNSEESGNTVEHPIEEKIPHYDNDHLAIESGNSFSNMQEEPEKLILLRQYLEDPHSFTKKPLNIAVGSAEPGFNVISTAGDRFILLDVYHNKLVEYDLKTDSAITIAETGRGPGDIFQSREMIQDDDFLYVIGSNMQLSKFDYRSTPVEFNEVVPLEFIPSSIAPAGDSLAILGAPRISTESGDAQLENNMNDMKVVYLLDKNGNELGQLGDSYDIDGHWMLLRTLVSDGMIRYSPKEHVFVLTFRRFPFLYIYDASDLTLRNSYKISDFMIGKSKYRPDSGRLQVTMEDHSLIKNVHLIDEQYAWIEVESRKNYSEELGTWDRRMNYYVVNLSDQADYYIGGVEIGDDIPYQQFYLTDHSLVIHEEDSLYAVEYSN